MTDYNKLRIFTTTTVMLGNNILDERHYSWEIKAQEKLRLCPNCNHIVLFDDKCCNCGYIFDAVRVKE